jgi:hypothetical protein
MSRIRSIMPGQWTDDRFITCSPLARLLALALRNEADDNGIFEWNPVKLKVRLLPMDACDVAALLNELAEAGQVWRYEVDGKGYGMIRNFQVWQKTRKPTFYHAVPTGLLPDGYAVHPTFKEGKVRNQYRTKAASGEASTEPVPYQCGTEGDLTGVSTPKGKGKSIKGKGGEESTSNSADAEALLSAWNDMAFRCGLPKVRDLSEKRKRVAERRLRDKGWRLEYPSALDKIAESDFLRGLVRGKPWKATFDWFVQPDSVTKILEGDYDNTNGAITYEGQGAEVLW